MNKTISKTHILVVGGGFGGVKAALEASKSGLFDVTLLSDRPNFHYYPTLYHTATGGTARQSRIPLAELFENTGVKVKIGSAVHIDKKKKIVKDADGHVHMYDVLIMSLGVVTNYFGIEGLKEFSYGIKSPEEARRFKDHLHNQLTSDGKPDLNYVIVGGGPTGIELSGALSTYLREIMAAHGIKHRTPHIDLIEAAPTLVPRMSKGIQKAAAKRLRKLGVKLYLGKTVQGATAEGLTVDGKPIQSHTIVWTAGVSNHPFFKDNGFTLNERGTKVTVNEYLQADDGVYVIGDNADTKYGGVAQTALYDALFVVDNLEREARGDLMRKYEPKQPIYVLPVGENWAAVQWGNRNLFGFVGYLLRNAADWIGFKDLQPFWKATKQWATEFDNEESCPQCAKALGAKAPDII
ncbi:MAG TPA: FAD-dependent oxidoreductase [Candidatus Saccharimonadales bacterium]|nr:FAD-dependent oxidoreductase [Candidatus Saccharimonadales bacterium]